VPLSAAWFEDEQGNDMTKQAKVLTRRRRTKGGPNPAGLQDKQHLSPGSPGRNERNVLTKRASLVTKLAAATTAHLDNQMPKPKLKHKVTDAAQRGYAYGRILTDQDVARARALKQ